MLEGRWHARVRARMCASTPALCRPSLLALGSDWAFQGLRVLLRS